MLFYSRSKSNLHLCEGKTRESEAACQRFMPIRLCYNYYQNVKYYNYHIYIYLMTYLDNLIDPHNG